MHARFQCPVLWIGREGCLTLPPIPDPAGGVCDSWTVADRFCEGPLVGSLCCTALRGGRRDDPIGNCGGQGRPLPTCASETVALYPAHPERFWTRKKSSLLDQGWSEESDSSPHRAFVEGPPLSDRATRTAHNIFLVVGLSLS